MLESVLSGVKQGTNTNAFLKFLPTWMVPSPVLAGILTKHKDNISKNEMPVSIIDL